MPRKKASPKKEVAVVPVEKGVNEQGIPFVRAMVIKSEDVSLRPKRTDIPRKQYDKAKLVEPHLRPSVLDELLIASPMHAICVQKKARLVAGLGMKVIAKGFNEREARVTVRTWEKADKEKRKELDKDAYKKAKKTLDAYTIEREKLWNWIEDASDQTILIEIIERFWYDYEAFGNGNLEIRRDQKGEPARLVHVPSIKLKVTKGADRLAFYENPQMIQPIWFKNYGDPRHLNSVTGEWREWKGVVGEETFDPGQDWGEHEANEILRVIAYHPRDMNYGIPVWYSSLVDMLGGIESRDFMLKFFSEKAVPLYAVLLEGGSWNEDTIKRIQGFFRREIVGNYHATLALEVPQGGKITFEQISPEPKWWPFILKYRDSVRDIIVSVHGLTPAIVGVIETAHLGGGDGSQQMDMVKTAEIKPRQEKLEWIINVRLVKEGMGLPHVMIKFDEIDVRDELSVVNAVTSLYSNPARPAITSNEAREMLRKEPVDAEWADELLLQDPQFGLLPIGQISEAVRQQAKSVQMAGQQAGQELQPQQQAATPDFASLFAGVEKQMTELMEKAITANEQLRKSKRNLQKEILDALNS